LLNNSQYTTKDRDHRDRSVSPFVKGTKKDDAIPNLASTLSNSNCQVSLCSNSNRQQLIASFFQKNNKFMAELYGQGTWASMVPAAIEISKPLEFAGLTVALAQLGLGLDDRYYAQQSLKLYGQSLQQIQLALMDPVRMYSDELLGACMLLSMYELMECPSQSGSGYLNHHNACARLVQLRGPEAHTKGLAHMIFLQYRHWAVRISTTIS
jgi:hypothetical protein